MRLRQFRRPYWRHKLDVPRLNLTVGSGKSFCFCNEKTSQQTGNISARYLRPRAFLNSPNLEYKYRGFSTICRTAAQTIIIRQRQSK